MSTVSRGLWKDAADRQVELELSSDTEEGRRGTARQNLHFLSRFERTSAQASRTSNEQVRSLTELFILISKLQKNSHYKSGRGKPSFDEGRQTSSPIRRSATLSSVPSGRVYGAHHTGTGATPGSVRRPRHVNTLERIDSIVDEHTGSASQQIPASQDETSVPSPRALRRAKSSVSRWIRRSTD